MKNVIIYFPDARAQIRLYIKPAKRISNPNKFYYIIFILYIHKRTVLQYNAAHIIRVYYMSYNTHAGRQADSHSGEQHESKHHQPNKVAIKYFYGIGWCAAWSVYYSRHRLADTHTRIHTTAMQTDESRQPAVVYSYMPQSYTKCENVKKYPVVLVMSASEIVVSSTKHNLNTASNSASTTTTG